MRLVAEQLSCPRCRHTRHSSCARHRPLWGGEAQRGWESCRLILAESGWTCTWCVNSTWRADLTAWNNSEGKCATPDSCPNKTSPRGRLATCSWSIWPPSCWHRWRHRHLLPSVTQHCHCLSRRAMSDATRWYYVTGAWGRTETQCRTRSATKAAVLQLCTGCSWTLLCEKIQI